MFTASPGSILADRYLLIAEHSRGATVSVWRAHDKILDRPVAVKILQSGADSDAEAVERFDAEGRRHRAIVHPSIVEVHDIFTDPTHAIVLEWMDGLDLRQRLNQGMIAAGDVAKVGAAIADALTALHSLGIVHRDVKPSNILMSSSGAVKLTDFGIAERHAADSISGGVVLGTAKYSSPEQVRGLALDGRSDIYSLCTVMYEALTGRVPFQRDTETETAGARLDNDPRDLRLASPDSPPTLSEIIMTGLRLHPSERWDTAESLASAIRTQIDTVVSPASASAGPRPVLASSRPDIRPSIRRKIWPRVVGFSLATAVAGLGLFLIIEGGSGLIG